MQHWQYPLQRFNNLKYFAFPCWSIKSLYPDSGYESLIIIFLSVWYPYKNIIIHLAFFVNSTGAPQGDEDHHITPASKYPSSYIPLIVIHGAVPIHGLPYWFGTIHEWYLM